uniref:Uncharacterized protein n=1 Tax=Sphaeramia orbicularis TaxID=375764 RepID=A0A673CQ31_9TELE
YLSKGLNITTPTPQRIHSSYWTFFRVNSHKRLTANHSPSRIHYDKHVLTGYSVSALLPSAGVLLCFSVNERL